MDTPEPTTPPTTPAGPPVGSAEPSAAPSAEPSADREVDLGAELLEDLRAVWQRMPMPRMAFSPGGRHGELNAPLGAGLVLGDLVVIERDGEPSIVAQVQSLELGSRVAGEVETASDLALPGRTVISAKSAPLLRYATGDVLLLGVLRPDGTFDRTIPAGGFEERLHRPATDEECRTVRAALAGDDALLEVGTVVGSPNVAAHLKAKGFARHTFLCGQSGSGKTYAMGVVLERLQLATDLPLVIFDPNSDHVHPGELRPDALDHPDAEAYAALHPQFLVARARRQAPDEPLAIHFSDLPTPLQAPLMRLDPVDDLDAHAALRAATASLAVPYDVGDVVAAARALGTPAGDQLATRIDNLGLAQWGLWCRPGDRSLVERGPLRHRALVLDLGSLETPAERILVCAALLSWLWANREARKPMLLVVDEAHNVFPATPLTELERLTTEVGIAIAAEGRKYGLHLLLATQRPGRVHPNIVSQCDNLALLRVNSVTDVDDLCQLFSHVPPGLIRQAPDFQLGQVLFAGPVSDLPTRTQIARRLSPEGGGDLPADWAAHR